MSTQNRVITAWATRGQQKAKLETNVATWGELKPLLEKEGFDLSTLAATESVNRNDLAHNDAKLPEGDFIIFLRPVKTKSGMGLDVAGKGFKELRALVTTDEIKEHLNQCVPGKSWTQLKTDELRDGLASYGGGSTSPTASASDGETTNADRVVQINSLLTEISNNSSSDEVKERVDIILEELEGLGQLVSDEADPAAAQDAQENEELKKTFEDMKSGYEDACSARNF